MAKNNRDDFSPKTRLQIAKRAGWLCSDPSCRRLTVGSNSEGDDEIMLGIAAHICAAAPGGPRYNSNQTPEQRSAPDNGIWMCRIHAAAIDAKDSKYTETLLYEWKAKAQEYARHLVLHGGTPQSPAVRVLADGGVDERLRNAAIEDLEVFRRTQKWPATDVALTLEVPRGQVFDF